MNAEDAAVSAQGMKPALRAHFYTSPDVFRIGTRRLFHGHGVWVGRADQVPSPGDWLHVSVAGESIVVLRGRDDALRAFYNVCRHRGSPRARTPPPAAPPPCPRRPGPGPRPRAAERRASCARITPGPTT